MYLDVLVSGWDSLNGTSFIYTLHLYASEIQLLWIRRAPVEKSHHHLISNDTVFALLRGRIC
jgi:hypothetical protein